MTGEPQASLTEGRSLPVEPQSRSELLAATHVFAVEIVKVAVEPWPAQKDSIQERTLRMEVKLSRVFKGKLDVLAGEMFPLEVTQRQVSDFIAWGYMGLWSHASPAAGVRYLIVAKGRTGRPAELMQDGCCDRLFEGASAADAEAAIEAETRIASKPALETAREALGFARGRASATGELFANYLWARLRPTFVARYQGVLPDVLGLLASPEPSAVFRGALLTSFDREIGYLDEPPDLVRQAAQTYVRLLMMEEAAPLRDGIAHSLDNAVFDEAVKPRWKAAELVPATEDRMRVAAALEPLESEHGHRLRNWLAVSSQE